MSEWTPKDGDRVMVGEHGPYRRAETTTRGTVVILGPGPHGGYVGEVLPEWLTPAPEPEPDEPTAFGALVRDGDGRLWVHRPYGGTGAPEWDAADRLSTQWRQLPRPITVILADPAEVETLRADLAETKRLLDVARHNAESRLQSAMAATANHLQAEKRADELQRRIDTALALTNPQDIDTWLTQGAILRGES